MTAPALEKPVRFDCPRCEGSGEWAVLKPNARSYYEMDPYEVVQCRKCDGTGSLTIEEVPAWHSR